MAALPEAQAMFFLRGASKQLIRLGDTMEKLAKDVEGGKRLAEVREEAIVAFKWLVAIRDALAELEFKLRQDLPPDLPPPTPEQMGKDEDDEDSPARRRKRATEKAAELFSAGT